MKDEQREEAATSDAVKAGRREDERAVRAQVNRLAGFVSDLSMDDVRQGDWFVKLLAFSLDRYVTQVDADYLSAKYPHLPADAVVRARIKMASRYAAIEGGLSATAYTGIAVGFLGSFATTSAVTVPAAATSFVVDLAYGSQVQLRLAHDIAVFYGVPVDYDDPDDLWRFVKIAFGIKTGQAAGNLALKGAPTVLRPLLKKVFSGATLQAAKGLPGIGKYLLQRNIVKFGIPGISIPVTTGVNYWMTRATGDYAAQTFRREARLVEAAHRAAASTPEHETLAWVMWLVMTADAQVAESQYILLHHVTRLAAEAGLTDEALTALRDVVEVDVEAVHLRVRDVTGDREPLYRAGVLAAAVDGKLSKNELRRLEGLADTCGLVIDEKAARDLARSWA